MNLFQFITNLAWAKFDVTTISVATLEIKESFKPKTVGGISMSKCVRCENYFPDEEMTKFTFFVMERKLTDDTTKRIISPTFNYITCERCRRRSYLYDTTWNHNKWWYRNIKTLFALDRLYDDAPKIKVQRSKNARKEQ